MENRLVTIGRYFNPLEAELVRACLEAAGVPAWLQDANLVNINWLYAPAVGGIRLQVKEEDVGRAEEILAGALVEPDGRGEEGGQGGITS